MGDETRILGSVAGTFKGGLITRRPGLSAGDATSGALAADGLLSDSESGAREEDMSYTSALRRTSMTSISSPSSCSEESIIA